MEFWSKRWMILFLMLDLHLHNLSDFLEESKEEPSEESKDKVVLVSWSSFVTDYIVLGKVDLLILDPEGIVKIVTKRGKTDASFEDAETVYETSYEDGKLENGSNLESKKEEKVDRKEILLLRAAMASRKYLEDSLRDVYSLMMM